MTTNDDARRIVRSLLKGLIDEEGFVMCRGHLEDSISYALLAFADSECARRVQSGDLTLYGKTVSEIRHMIRFFEDHSPCLNAHLKSKAREAL